MCLAYTVTERKPERSETLSFLFSALSIFCFRTHSFYSPIVAYSFVSAHLWSTFFLTVTPFFIFFFFFEIQTISSPHITLRQNARMWINISLILLSMHITMGQASACTLSVHVPPVATGTGISSLPDLWHGETKRKRLKWGTRRETYARRQGERSIAEVQRTAVVLIQGWREKLDRFEEVMSFCGRCFVKISSAIYSFARKWHALI